MNKVLHLKANEKGRDFIVGDLHGCLEDLLLTLTTLSFDEKVDRLFCVGDLIDRGPDSKACAELIRKPWFHAVRGNHEEMMIDSLIRKNGEWFRVWQNNGGQWIYKPGTYELQYSNEEMKQLAKEFDELPLIITVGEGEDRFNMVHAELFRHGKQKGENISDKDIDEWTFHEKDEDAMLWGRSLIMFRKEIDWNPHEGLSLTYVGHTPLNACTRRFQHLYLDGGCVYHHLKAKSSENVSLMIACHQTKLVYQWSPNWKTLTKLPYNDIIDMEEIVAKYQEEQKEIIV